MFLSLNGSPLAFPTLDWFRSLSLDKGPADKDGSGGPAATGAADALARPAVKRSNSSIVIRRDPSFAMGGLHSHSRSHSQASTRPSSSHALAPPPATPARSAAMVAIPTKDGHLLEFDPLQTSPGAIDALGDISESAKKQAKGDVTRLVRAAMEKWTVSEPEP